MEKNFSKVPELTLLFWTIKILATTLGETGGDAVSMSMNLGYGISTIIFATIFFIAVSWQIKSLNFQPTIYWITIIATTTVGTTIADFINRTLGLGYARGSSLIAILLLLSILIWRFTLGSISIHSIKGSKSEIFYWITIMFSQTLGTSLGDWTADSEKLGYSYSALIFGSLLSVIALINYSTKISRTFLFWSAFILTRPLGAVFGDFLDKPYAKGGLELSRYSISIILIFFIICGVKLFPSRWWKISKKPNTL
jgi:uncharacterized membrane-anchored protein